MPQETTLPRSRPAPGQNGPPAGSAYTSQAPARTGSGHTSAGRRPRAGPLYPLSTALVRPSKPSPPSRQNLPTPPERQSSPSMPFSRFRPTWPAGPRRTGPQKCLVRIPREGFHPVPRTVLLDTRTAQICRRAPIDPLVKNRDSYHFSSAPPAAQPPQDQPARDSPMRAQPENGNCPYLARRHSTPVSLFGNVPARGLPRRRPARPRAAWKSRSD